MRTPFDPRTRSTNRSNTFGLACSVSSLTGEPPAFDFAIQDLLAKLFGRALRLALEHLADLVARATRADVRQPVARRLGGGRRDDLDRLGIAERA